MKRWIVILALLLGCRAEQPIEIRQAQGVAGSYRIGVSVKKFTPSDEAIARGEIFLGGHGIAFIRDMSTLSSTKASGVHDDVFVRALVIDDGCEQVAVAVLDAAIIGSRLIREIEAGASAATGIPKDNIYISATHSHTAPDLLGYMIDPLKWESFSDEFRADVIKQSVAAISEAHRTRIEARLFGSSGTETAFNRRGYKQPDGSWHSDPSVNVLEARDLNDATILTLINFGCHPVCLTPAYSEISRDFCGYLVDHVEGQTGAPAIFIQGALGDINPYEHDVLDNAADSHALARERGLSIANAALASMQNQQEISGAIYSDSQSFETIISNGVLQGLLILLGDNVELDTEWRFPNGQWIDTRVRYLRLGEMLQAISIPGEGITDLNLTIKDQMSLPFKLTFNLTGDNLLYLLPSANWGDAPDGMPGNLSDLPYEESMALDRFFGDKVIQQATNLIRRDRGGEQPFAVGFAQLAITPSGIEPWQDLDGDGVRIPLIEPFEDLNGNGRFDSTYIAGMGIIRPAAGVHDDLYTTACIIDDGKRRIAIVSMDLVSWMIDDVHDVEALLPAELGIDKLIMHATHNHEGPDTNGMWSILDLNTTRDYTDYVKQRSAEAIEAAVAELQPARMFIGQELSRDHEVAVMDSRPYPEVLDKGVRVALFRSAASEEVLGTIVNFGNHVETLWKTNLQITSDFVHYMRLGISDGIDQEPTRKGLGGTTMFLAGNIGGLATTPPSLGVYDKRTGETYLEPDFEKARAQGFALADIVLDMEENGQLTANEEPAIEIYVDKFHIGFQNEKFLLLWAAGVIKRKVDFIEGQLQTLTEVSLLKIGELWLANIPGELYPEIAVGGIGSGHGADFKLAPIEVPPLRPLMQGRVNFMVNLGNDHLGYFIPKSEWDAKAPWLYGDDDPEVTYGEDNSLGPDAAATVHAHLFKVLRAAAE